MKSNSTAIPSRDPDAVRNRSAFWDTVLESHLGEIVTPAYVFSTVPVVEALREMETAWKGVAIRHFLSVKTQPLPAWIRWWVRQGRPVEVVSEWEMEMALRCGVAPECLLVNGPLKHRWLQRLGAGLRGLRVHLDSVLETEVLAPLFAENGWKAGIRLNTREEYDPESPSHPTQFGMDEDELRRSMEILRKHESMPESVHFHLRTNIPDVATYERALEDASRLCLEVGWAPRYVDMGGGLPPPGVRGKNGLALNRQFGWEAMTVLLKKARKWFPGMEEWWMENGRWMSARSGVFVTTVRDIKVRRGMRQLICDGGRTMNALVSIWEDHDVTLMPERGGKEVLTTVNGPTCMAFDKLYRGPMSEEVRVGDRVVWHDAGAYHLPWETRFSHGLAGIWWHEEGFQSLQCVRRPELFESWWSQWS